MLKEMNQIETFKYTFWVLNVPNKGEKRGQVVPIEFMVDKEIKISNLPFFKNNKMTDKKVRIDEYLVDKIKKFRDKKKENSIKYPSDKQFIQVAVVELLKKEDEDGPGK